MSNLQINTRVRRLFHYIDDFQKGIIRVPAFQREFVWDNDNKLALFDSLKNGYPIGSILFWRSDEKADLNFSRFETEKIGSYYIPSARGEVLYILDGFQRISTLFGCLVNPKETKLLRDDQEWFEQYNIVYNLKEDKFETNKKKRLDDLEIYKVPLYKFVDSKEFFGFQRDLYNSGVGEKQISDYIKKYEILSARLIDYEIPSIDIIGGTPEEVVEIFSRINSTGIKISDDWKMSALSFDRDKNFHLGSEIDELLKDLERLNFQNLKRNLIRQCILNSFGKVFFDKTNPEMLEEITRRPDFIDVARNTLANIKKAVEFLYYELSVLEFRLLPYGNQLIFLTDFFSKTKHPSDDQLMALKRWFWITSYAGYFTIYNLSQQRKAYYQFQSFINGSTDDPLYIEKKDRRFSTSEFPAKLNLGSVRAKSLALFMINHSRGFHRADEEGFGLKMVPIFIFKNQPENTKRTENTICLVVNRDRPHQHSVGKSFDVNLRTNHNYQNLFIDERTINLSALSDNEFLLHRKEQIKDAERAFVTDLNLDYED